MAGGILHFLVEFYRRFLRHDIPGTAAKATYYLLLSFFPLCLLLIHLLQNTSVLEAVLPSVVAPLLGSLSKPEAAFQTSSVLLILWSASACVWALMTGIHTAYTGRRKIKMLQGRARALLFLFVLAAVTFLCVSLTFFSGALIHWLFPALNQGLLNASRLVILLLFIYLFVTLLYLLTPNIRARFTAVAPGAALTAVGWVAATWGFEVYMRLFSNYSALYGSIEVFLGLTLWLYIVSTVLLCGAELNVMRLESASRAP